MKIIAKSDWVYGLGRLLSLRRVKVLINSVNDPGNFLNLINEILFIFFETNNKKIIRILIGAYTGLLTTEELEETLKKLTRTSFSFFKFELE